MITSKRNSRPTLAPQKHRILLYTTCYNVLDGVTLTIRKLETEILAAGHHVCILSTRSGDPRNTHLDGTGTHANRRVVFVDNSQPIPFISDPNNPEIQYHIGFSLSASTKAAIANFAPTLIHLTTPDTSATHLIHYARQKEIPIMGTYHSNIPEYCAHYQLGMFKPVIGTYIRHQYNFLQAVYVPTPYIKNFLQETHQMDRVTDLQIWGRGVDAAKFHPERRSLKFRARFGDDNTVLLCWVGRLVPEKRPDIFASVVRRLAARGVNFHAVIVGAGPCEDQMRGSGLPNTTFCGWMNPEQLAVAYASCDVFLFPSGVETFGNVTLEAAASGLPVVVEEGCSGHLVKDNGFACPEGNEDAFFRACLKLVRDDKLRAECSRASRKLALGLEKRAVVRQMLDNYSKVTSEFYTEFGGHHTNRDDCFLKPGSFAAGTYPIPLAFDIFERMMQLTFFVIATMTNGFIMMQDTIASFGLPTLRHMPSYSQNQEPVQRPQGSTAPAVVSFSGSQLSSSPSGDGGSTSNSSTADDDSFVSDNSSTTTELHQPLYYPAVKVVPVIEYAVAAWIAWMLFICRVESTIRNSLYKCCTPGLGLSTKRKNSMEAHYSSKVADAVVPVSVRRKVDSSYGHRRRTLQDV